MSFECQTTNNGERVWLNRWAVWLWERAQQGERLHSALMASPSTATNTPFLLRYGSHLHGQGKLLEALGLCSRAPWTFNLGLGEGKREETDRGRGWATLTPPSCTEMVSLLHWAGAETACCALYSQRWVQRDSTRARLSLTGLPRWTGPQAMVNTPLQAF